MTNQKISRRLTFVAPVAIATLSAFVFPGQSIGQQPVSSPVQAASSDANETARISPNGAAPAPSAGFRPLGAPSRVDRFRPPKVTASRPQSDAYPTELAPLHSGESSITLLGVTQANDSDQNMIGGSVSPTAFTQNQFVVPGANSGGDYAAPVTGETAPPVARSTNPSGMGLPPNPTPNRDPASLTRGASPTTTPLPQNTMTQPGMTQPGMVQPLAPSPSDLTPVPTPQMNSQWSNTGNSPLVTGPSGYRAVFWDCSAPTVVPTGGPYVYAPPTVMPNAPQAIALTSNYPGYRPLFTLGQENYNVRLGQGIVGQPTVYVPGQPVRNFFRYLFP